VHGFNNNRFFLKARRDFFSRAPFVVFLKNNSF